MELTYVNYSQLLVPTFCNEKSKQCNMRISKKPMLIQLKTVCYKNTRTTNTHIHRHWHTILRIIRKTRIQRIIVSRGVGKVAELIQFVSQPHTINGEDTLLFVGTLPPHPQIQK